MSGRIDHLRLLGREGLPWPEIAERLGMTIDQVRRRWNTYSEIEDRRSRRLLTRGRADIAPTERRAVALPIAEFPDDVRFQDAPRAVADKGSTWLPMRPATHTHGASSAAMAVG